MYYSLNNFFYIIRLKRFNLLSLRNTSLIIYTVTLRLENIVWDLILIPSNFEPVLNRSFLTQTGNVIFKGYRPVSQGTVIFWVCIFTQNIFTTFHVRAQKGLYKSKG